MKVIDTSVLVSLFNPKDIHHESAVAWMSGLDEEVCLLSPSLALVELTATFARAGYSEQSTLRILEKVKALLTIESTDDCIQDGIQAALRAKCRGADSVFIGLCLYLGAELVTFDQEQKQRGATLVSVAEIS